MNNREKILEIIELNQDIYNDLLSSNKKSSKELSEHYRPRITVEQVKDVLEQLYSGEISFSKATQILNGDEDDKNGES